MLHQLHQFTKIAATKTQAIDDAFRLQVYSVIRFRRALNHSLER